MTKPIQKILFGSPGTGKSHEIKNIIAPNLGVEVTSENYIPTVFHPEYTYGDFMGKLMPFTNDSGKVEYHFYRGHFLKAVAQAYKNILIAYLEDVEKIIKDYNNEFGTAKTTDTEPEIQQRIRNRQKTKPKNVLLVIDEINRGNSSATFGSVFQLLDRESNGWSTYPISISDLEFKGLLQEMSFFNKKNYDANGKETSELFYFNDKEIGRTPEKYDKYQSFIFEEINEPSLAKERKIKLPSNLSIVATMNTSDNSIYFMDSAFKRRWDWEFIEIEDHTQRTALANRKISLYGQDKGEWCNFVDKLNSFIRGNYKVIRKIEDKQVGYRFINEPTITEVEIKNKLMFFIWDSVFNNNKKPLVDLLGVPESELVTFGQFTKKEQVIKFVTKILSL